MVSSKPASTPAGGLVERQRFRMAQHGPGDQQPLRLAAGHLAEILPQHAAVETHQVEFMVQMADEFAPGCQKPGDCSRKNSMAVMGDDGSTGNLWGT